MLTMDAAALVVGEPGSVQFRVTQVIKLVLSRGARCTHIHDESLVEDQFTHFVLFSHM